MTEDYTCVLHIEWSRPSLQVPAHCWETASCPHSDLFIALKNYQINKYKLVAEAQQPEGCIKSLKNQNQKSIMILAVYIYI